MSATERRLPQPLRAGILYFLLVFGAGFLLGTIRVLLLLPLLDERTAELLEMPLMLVVIYFAARFILRRHPGLDKAGAVAAGLTAFVLLLAVEFTLVLALRGMTIADYYDSRDPVALGAYLVSLLLFAAMPRLLLRRGASPRR